VSAFKVTHALGPSAIQDLGRPGFLMQCLPRGGVLAPRMLRALNESLGNQANAPALEIFGQLELRALTPAMLCCDGEQPTVLAQDEVFRVNAGDRRFRLLAARGGFHASIVFGGRGLLPSAKIGGQFGRWLQVGDALQVGQMFQQPLQEPTQEQILNSSSMRVPPQIKITILPGPHASRLCNLAALTETNWIIDAQSDRTGLRLRGESLALHPSNEGSPSFPMIAGAIQIPPDGQPVVLGPDHPVSGGYPVVAVVHSSALAAIFSLPLRSEVGFEFLR